MGIKVKEPDFNSSIDSMPPPNKEDNPSIVKEIQDEIYNPDSYWNENINELMKMKEIEVELPGKENEIKNIFGMKETVKKSKNIFNVFNVKQMTMELNENVNKNDEELNMFFDTKPNSNDTDDAQNAAI